MREWRWLAGLAGAAAACSTALAAAWGMVGAVWGWADVVNHFGPVLAGLAALSTAAARVWLPPSRGREWAVGAGVGAFAFFCLTIALEAGHGARDRVAGPATIRILSMNVWWDSPHPERELAAIRASGADLVALQEADGFAERTSALADVYPYRLKCGEACDTAILSKTPILDSGREQQATWPGGTDFLWVRTTAPDGRPVTLATVHLFWPIPPWIQRGQRGRVAELAARLPRDEMVLTGDFNLTPWSWAMRRLDRQLAPLTRRTHGLLTFPATWPLPFLPLDQVFAGRQWKTVSIRRAKRAGSDHYPVIIELKR